MTRELKFRVWDTQENRFIEKGYLITINGDGRISYAYGKSSGGDGVSGERFIIQQYTGLQNSDGTEIYEGDILKIWIEDTLQMNNYEIKSIEEFYFDCNRDDTYYKITKFEKIGNIFETPKLLK